MNTQSKILEDLLPLIYAAASNHDAWIKFCAALHDLTGTPTVLFSHDITTQGNIGVLGSGWDPDYLASYERHYGKINPWMDMNNSMPVGYVGLSDQAVPRDQLFKTEFYNDWLQPQDNLIVGAATVCYRNKNQFLALSSMCTSKNAEKNLSHVMGTLECLGNHVARAIEMSAVLMNGNNGSMAHLETSRHAIIAIRKNGNVAAINPAAESLLQHCSLLALENGGKLTGGEEDIRQYISDALAAMKMHTFELPLRPLALRDATFGTFLMHAHIFPQHKEVEFPEIMWNDPLIGCFVITGQGGLEEVSVVEMLSAGFGATPAEARLGQALMMEQSLYEYAEQNSLSKHTVRNQMRALLAKTGSRNQSSFIVKIARLISPFHYS